MNFLKESIELSKRPLSNIRKVLRDNGLVVLFNRSTRKATQRTEQLHRVTLIICFDKLSIVIINERLKKNGPFKMK